MLDLHHKMLEILVFFSCIPRVLMTNSMLFKKFPVTDFQSLLESEDVTTEVRIPYGQSSAKIPVIMSSGHLVIWPAIWSSGHLVIRSSSHPLTWSSSKSSSHPVIKSYSHQVIWSSCHFQHYYERMDEWTHNIRTYRSASQTKIYYISRKTKRQCCHE